MSRERYVEEHAQMIATACLAMVRFAEPARLVAPGLAQEALRTPELSLLVSRLAPESCPASANAIPASPRRPKSSFDIA